MKLGRPFGSQGKGEDSARKLSNYPEGANKIKRGGQALNGLGRRTGQRNRRYARGGKYHLAPKCPRRKQWKPTAATNPPQ